MGCPASHWHCYSDGFPQVPAAVTHTRPRLIALLGMHRSGTSFLAGELANAGLCLGDANRSGSTANAKGNQEYQPLVIFHENCLKAAGGRWDAPPGERAWQPRQQERALQLAQQLLGQCHGQAGFKDPRTLLFWEQWQALPITLQAIGIFRHPSTCSQSLVQRDGMSSQQAISLWMQYNRALLAAWQQQPFPLVDFDTPEHLLQQTIRRIANWLGLGDGDKPKEPFLDTALRHHRDADASCDPEALALHRQLQEAAGSFWSLGAAPEPTKDSI